jgi:hypothetical protein
MAKRDAPRAFDSNYFTSIILVKEILRARALGADAREFAALSAMLSPTGFERTLEN